MELNKTYKVIIEGYDVNGYGVTHIDNKVVFVEGALESEEVIIKITSIHKKITSVKHMWNILNYLFFLYNIYR